ncbi:unnamed protein product [Amoebophrya sp. A25]|nr:unnamed protein product [Amoebophrya sp. A25]|eukprot:GSA25T00013925001.1
MALACVKRPSAALIAHLLGDANNRLHHVTEACLASIITQLGPTPVMAALTSHPDGGLSPKKKVTPRLVHLPWRALEARLELTHTLISICGPPSLDASRSYSVAMLMPVVVTGLQHQMWDVRHLAIEVCTLLFQSVGLKLLPFLKEVPPNLIESLNARFSEVDPGNYGDETEFSNALTQAREQVESVNSPRSAQQLALLSSTATSNRTAYKRGKQPRRTRDEQRHATENLHRGGRSSPGGRRNSPRTSESPGVRSPGGGGSVTIHSMMRSTSSTAAGGPGGGSMATGINGNAQQDHSHSPVERVGTAASTKRRRSRQERARSRSPPERSSTRSHGTTTRSPRPSVDPPPIVERPASHSYVDYQQAYEDRLSRAFSNKNAPIK